MRPFAHRGCVRHWGTSANAAGEKLTPVLVASFGHRKQEADSGENDSTLSECERSSHCGATRNVPVWPRPDDHVTETDGI